MGAKRGVNNLDPKKRLAIISFIQILVSLREKIYFLGG